MAEKLHLWWATHTEKMTPASYFTGMEICTVLSCRVDSSSSLSLWVKDQRFSKKNNFWGDRKQQNIMLLLSPCGSHIYLNHWLNVSRVRVEYDFETSLQTSDHNMNLMSRSEERITGLLTMTCWVLPLCCLLRKDIQLHTPLLCYSVHKSFPADEKESCNMIRNPFYQMHWKMSTVRLWKLTSPLT